MKTLTSLPGLKTSPTIFAVILWVPLTSVYVSPTAVLVSLRKSVLTSISVVLADWEYQVPEISAKPDHDGLL
jgi:hypothetical protein